MQCLSPKAEKWGHVSMEWCVMHLDLSQDTVLAKNLQVTNQAPVQHANMLDSLWRQAMSGSNNHFGVCCYLLDIMCIVQVLNAAVWIHV